MMIRVQDLPDISNSFSESDKVLIVKTNGQGLTTIDNLKKYETAGADENNSNQ